VDVTIFKKNIAGVPGNIPEALKNIAGNCMDIVTLKNNVF
jgi:hypothetical protein